MISEILTSLREASRERIRNPLIGSFIISTVAINWRPLYYLIFGADSAKTKLAEIELYSHECLCVSLGIPLGISIGYVFLMPWFIWLIQWAQIRPVSARKILKLNQELEVAELKQNIHKTEIETEFLFEERRHKLDKEKLQLQASMGDKADKRDFNAMKSVLDDEIRRMDLKLRKEGEERARLLRDLEKAKQDIPELKASNDSLERENTQLRNERQRG